MDVAQLIQQKLNQLGDIYDKLGKALKLPAGKLAGLADLQRKQELKNKVQSPPVPLFKEVRELLLAKCKREKRTLMRAIFDLRDPLHFHHE